MKKLNCQHLLILFNGTLNYYFLSFHLSVLFKTIVFVFNLFSGKN